MQEIRAGAKGEGRCKIRRVRWKKAVVGDPGVAKGKGRCKIAGVRRNKVGVDAELGLG